MAKWTTDPVDDGEPMATYKQLAFLERHAVPFEAPLTRARADEAIRAYIATRRALEPTPKQARLLRDLGWWRPNMTRGEAFDLLAPVVGRKRRCPGVRCPTCNGRGVVE